MEHRKFAERICGEIALADHHGEAMKKWRQIFSISQSELARELGISPSVISDYEAGRRNPGVAFIKKFVLALIKIDSQRANPVISKYIDLPELSSAIIDLAEYSRAVKIDDFCSRIGGERLNNFERLINGHTVIDSLNAILMFNAYDFYKLFGFTSERALIFTKITSGRSPMVAVRVSSLKPSTVVLHGISKVDEMAIKIAEAEKIPLIRTELEVKEMIERLRRDFL
ncbi:MAG: helix-turn-helix domain-containing protein [Archaeoglobaceae archaeon]|nr:helix-turn-helix domain-containing protein [Archaeoglobaceae archaeon]MDW8128836.1 helix-turn-helix domain-containing protein [Archaeoglobaceae archaeon]